ncbi:MAG: hypothetical protein E4G94_01340 [ANME-2 cluster archaeon]|nr:MAG: hypothetical protein E4G94_01340 [ANME-2 cluster archaeon]
MVKAKDNRNISFSITGEERIPATEMVGAIQHIQNVIYHIGDYLNGTPNRPKGDFPQVVKDHCTLFITNLEMGSVIADMQIGDAQIGLPGLEGTYGERAITLADEFIKEISLADASLENLHNKIENPHRVNKILKEFEAMWPSVQSKRTLNFSFGGNPKKRLNPNQRDVIQSLLHTPLHEYEKEVFGRVIEIRVDEKRKIQLDTPEGPIECHYTSDIEDAVREVIGELVTIRGMMTPLKGKFILSIDNEVSIDDVSQYHLKTMKKDGIDIELMEEVLIDVDFEDDYYIASNDYLGLLSAKPKMKQVIEEIQEELAVLWLEYVAVDEDKLTASGKDLREKLISITGIQNG